MEVAIELSRDRLIEKHLDLPRRVVAEIYNLASVKRLGFEEACSIGYLSLVRVAGSYDATRGQKFVTWAFPTIRREILRYSRRFHCCVTLPDNAWFNNREKFIDKENTQVLKIVQTASAEKAENILFDKDPSPDILVEWQEEAAITRGVLALLPDVEQQIIHRHFFNGESFSSIAVDLGISHQRVCQIKNRALQRLATLLPSQKGDSDE